MPLLAASKLALNPFVSGPLLLALLTSPETIQNLLEKLHLRASGARLGTAKQVLQILLALGSVRYLNGLLSRMATNAGRVRSAPGWNWSHEVAVVTGGCSGIGYETAKRLAAHNIKVAILDVQALPDSFARIRSIHHFRCDVTSPEQVAQAARSISQVVGQPTILINNAGIVRPSTILETPLASLRRIFEINTLSHWTTTQQFLPGMISENKGHVVTVASLASHITLPRMADYSATKASAMAFHEGLAAELRQLYQTDGVLTSIVHPTYARTPLGDAVTDQVAAEGALVLTPGDVADEIVGAVLARRSCSVVVPRGLTAAAGIRAWPAWMQEAVRGRAGRREAQKIEV